ncbi:hypothetical protein PLEOSDRAFT_1089187 [Pleurotus ostreatus PC15]|uniref:Uncharacterized protein n=1 Tax=Pleurotus ostreatus (strain PC15) TaxID=1137138 RepID=A0A067NRH4_PLEO1|nr:hypothetical protein PLEOSDRAFT_1089187 [Pleurotus ostreatus PC15]
MRSVLSQVTALSALSRGIYRIVSTPWWSLSTVPHWEQRRWTILGPLRWKRLWWSQVVAPPQLGQVLPRVQSVVSLRTLPLRLSTYPSVTWQRLLQLSFPPPF